MKLRIKGDSLRIRVSPSEVARLLEAGRVEETIHFAPESGACLTYALEHAPVRQEIGFRWRPQRVTVVLSSDKARSWAEGDQISIQGSFAVRDGELAILVEKDFACLDESHAENKDTFPNPNRGKVC